MPSVTKKLDKIAGLLESRGLFKYATSVDEVANLLEEAESTVELCLSSASRKPLGDPSFPEIKELVSQHLKNNEDSIILEKLGNFYLDGKAPTVVFLKKIKTLLKVGTQLHNDDIALLREIQERLA